MVVYLSVCICKLLPTRGHNYLFYNILVKMLYLHCVHVQPNLCMSYLLWLLVSMFLQSTSAHSNIHCAWQCNLESYCNELEVVYG